MRRAIVPLLVIALAGVVSVCVAGSPPKPDLGNNASLNGLRVLPDDSAWNEDISKAPVDPNSAALVASIGANKPLHPDFGTVWKGHPIGIPYVVIDHSQAPLKITFTDYGDESDAGPYPIPATAPIEGGPDADGDRHVIVIDRDTMKLYETWRAFPVDNGRTWKAACGAIWDLKTGAPRKAGWTSADAAGLPVFPGLVRFDEVAGLKEIRHALRFTVQKSRRAYVAPATHFASKSNDAKLPPMGMRVRLRADFDLGTLKPEARVIAKALQTYGMIVADNGGDWFLSGSPSDQWDDDDLHTLAHINGHDFEVIKMPTIVTR